MRYGLRNANAPLVRDTLRLVDALLRRDLDAGPSLLIFFCRAGFYCAVDTQRIKGFGDENQEIMV